MRDTNDTMRSRPQRIQFRSRGVTGRSIDMKQIRWDTHWLHDDDVSSSARILLFDSYSIDPSSLKREGV